VSCATRPPLSVATQDLIGGGRVCRFADQFFSCLAALLHRSSNGFFANTRTPPFFFLFSPCRRTIRALPPTRVTRSLLLRLWGIPLSLKSPKWHCSFACLCVLFGRFFFFLLLKIRRSVEPRSLRPPPFASLRRNPDNSISVTTLFPFSPDVSCLSLALCICFHHPPQQQPPGTPFPPPLSLR